MHRCKNINLKPIVNRFNIGITLSLLSISAISPIAQAQQLVTLKDAIGLTFAQNPQLKTYIYQAKAAEGRIEQAGVSSPMTMGVGIEDAFGGSNRSGVSAMQTTLSLSWLLDGDIVDARQKVASAQSTLSTFNRDLQAIELAANTATIFVRLLSQQEKLKLAKMAQVEAAAAVRSIGERVKAGKSNAIDKLRAEADLSKKLLVTEDLTHEIAASKLALAAQWNGSSDFIVDGNLLNIPNSQTLSAERIENLRSNPKLQLFIEQQKIKQSEIALARQTQNPAWQVTAGMKRDEQVDDFSFIAGVSIPLGGNDRNKGQIIALNAQKNQQQAESDAWVKGVSTNLQLLNSKLSHSRHVIESLNRRTVPLLESAAVKAERAYLLGGYNFTDWYGVKQELISAQYELIEAYTDVHINNIEFERLTGVSLNN
ncbi:Outer membrane efflux protein [Shewanella piezotolerans WP3]|uniref:Outer membrane efflux protein n=1 Tax=Shewanella piezotolerans (strain WP3 / JCM 13877) TaxID=225849 RepID=B8CQ36_SHEPW|nr:TolC family protein [Shewanella piezotolerans]ACJ29899.1 Outer membrane efflux protein [Shewanella piezotolerans WP3]